MTTPVRIQRQRLKGWKAPPGTIYVGRGSLWGNPFVVGTPSACEFQDGGDPTPMIASLTLEQSLEFYRDMLSGYLRPEMHPHGHRWLENFRKRIQGASPAEWARTTLRGRSIMCWCGLAQKCHGDILIEVANG